MFELIDIRVFGVHLVVWLWTISGIVGVLARGWLLRKHIIDLRVATDFHLPVTRLSISRRFIESTIVNVLIKAGIIFIGISRILAERMNPALPSPTTVTGIVLLLIPWLLMLDALREAAHQRFLLRMAAPNREAIRLFMQQDRKESR